MATEILDQIKPTGHLEITKIYKDGTKEIVYSKSNVITVGMGVTLAEMFGAPTGASPTADIYQIPYFQLGDGGSTGLQVSGTVGLGSPLTVSEYGGSDPDFSVDVHDRWHNGAITVGEAFSELQASQILRTGNTGVSFTIFVGDQVANGISINEIGLFSKDPFNRQSPEASILCAYRFFTALVKDSTFSLSFKWTIIF